MYIELLTCIWQYLDKIYIILIEILNNISNMLNYEEPKV